MGRKGKYIKVQGTVLDALSGGQGEIAQLSEEMTEWRDNMEMGGLENTERFQTVQATADELENACDLETQIAYMESAGEEDDALSNLLNDQLEWSEFRKYGKQALNLSRADRMSNAAAGVTVAIEYLAEKAKALYDALPEESDEEPEDDEAKAEAEALQVKRDRYEEFVSNVEEIQSTVENVEGLEFPGMYG